MNDTAFHGTRVPLGVPPWSYRNVHTQTLSYVLFSGPWAKRHRYGYVAHKSVYRYCFRGIWESRDTAWLFCRCLHGLYADSSHVSMGATVAAGRVKRKEDPFPYLLGVIA